MPLIYLIWNLLLSIGAFVPLVGPPTVTAVKGGTSAQIVIAFILGLFLHFPGFFYALWFVWRDEAFAQKRFGRHIREWAHN